MSARIDFKHVNREAGGVNQAVMDVETITAPSSAGIVDRNKMRQMG